MSVFRVIVNNNKQGLMDINPSTGRQFNFFNTPSDPSIQRQIYVSGPNGGVRELSDGDTFTDCNYWKKFAYPNLPEEQAFIVVVTDDGIPWTENGDNTYPLVSTGSISAGGTAAVDYTLSDGGYAVFAQITNTGSNPMNVAINGAVTATFPLAAGATQVFNKGDFLIGALVLSSALGTSYQVIASVQTPCKS
jgi:hypothetical protein